MPPQECTIKRLFIPPREIHYLRFILEAYEGIAVLSTHDARSGLVQLNVAPGCEQEVDRILEAEKSNLHIRPVSEERQSPVPGTPTVPTCKE